MGHLCLTCPAECQHFDYGEYITWMCGINFFQITAPPSLYLLMLLGSQCAISREQHRPQHVQMTQWSESKENYMSMGVGIRVTTFQVVAGIPVDLQDYSWSPGSKPIHQTGSNYTPLKFFPSPNPAPLRIHPPNLHIFINLDLETLGEEEYLLRIIEEASHGNEWLRAPWF